MNVKAALAISMVFIGCCSNVVFLELVVKEDPGAGNLATFLQFLFIASVGFCTVGKFGFAKRNIPFKQYLLLVGFFWTSSVANNYAFDFNISMPLHMIFRAGSLMANMAMGVWILKKTYAPLKYLAIFMISAGIAICTLQSSGDVKAPRETHEDAAEEERLQFIDWLWWCLGIAILTFALFVSARMGIFQESLYSKHGKHPWEALYYTHLLPLVFWLPTATNLVGHVKLATETPVVEAFGFLLPRQVLYLILYVLTQGLCISAVYVLTTECASLTVTLTVTLRKFVSLLFSILYFRNPFTLGHWLGTFLVFLGTLIFTELLQKTIMLFLPTPKDKKKKKLYGEPIKLPENLESLPRAEHFAAQRHRWNTNEEIAAILISFDKHSEWQSKEVKIRPKSGSMLLYSRKKVRYRRDGYCWKKRKDGKTTREDHMKLKVQGTECIYGCYVHSAILPTFHRRCYWLLQNPDIVLVHYLNVPYPDDNKLATVAPSLALWADKKEWTKDELVSQLKPMFFSEDEPDINSDLEISTAETVEAIVGQLMEKQRAARAAALARQLECGCPDSTCQDSRNCTHPLRRIQAAKPPASDHHVSSTTGPSPRPMAHPPRQYTRDHRPAQQSASPLLLSLGQIQGGGGLLILNGTSSAQQHSSIVSPLSVTSFVCEEPRDRFRQQYKPTFVLKRELPDTQPTSRVQNSDTTLDMELQEKKVEIDFDRKIKVEPKSRSQIIASAPATPSRYPDLIERLESKVLTENCDDTLVLLGTDSHLASSGFFDETLELSHEDIQKTLSANMPTCDLDRNAVRSTDTANVMVSGIDTMDFIESCEAVASPTHVVDDNVFVNLDAFDMLGDFPELEVLDPSSITANPVAICEKSSPVEEPEKMQTDCSNEGALNITDYSPEWAYPEGGAKVLVAGPWTECCDQYTVLFDNFPVPSILVQNGLLRCYCPAHEAGLAALQVARGGRIVSDTVVFEYKAGPTPAPSSPASAPLPTLDFRRFSLLQRLQRLHGRLQIKIEPMDDNNQIDDVQLYSSPKFEERLVSFCRSLSNRSSGISEGFTTEPGEEGSSILHLAAALGYTKLTTALLRWRQDDNSLALEKEVNLGARDSDNCTPLMVASAAGHVQTAAVLARWAAGTRAEAGAAQAAAAARRAGHDQLARLLQRIYPPANDGVFLRPNTFLQKGRAGSLESNLVKRPSIDSGINMADAFRSNSAIDKSDGSSARWERSMSLPLDSDTSEDSLGDTKIGRRMDLALCSTARGAASPLIDVEALSEPASPPAEPPPAPPAGEQDDRVFTLAEQIIAAMPERIKNESSSLLSGCGLDGGGSGGEDTLMTPLLDDTNTFNTEFSFEFCDNTYRYCGGSTPSSGSVSPGSALSPPPPSPRAALASSGTPSATLQEFLNATTHFSSLTLNDREQRELYSAAITIQKAYRQYRGRQLQRRAAAAAITIQNCYRRYKQFAYLKQMHAAATVIQRGYRSMRARRLASTPIKRTYSQRRQNQAARKIQQFMRQSKIKLQSARVESGRVGRRSQDARPSSSQPIISTRQHTPNRVVDYLSPGTPMNADEDLLLELLFKM